MIQKKRAVGGESGKDRTLVTFFQPSKTLEISLFRNCRRSGMGRHQCRSIQGWRDDFLRAMVAVDECFFGIGVMADAAGSCFFSFCL